MLRIWIFFNQSIYLEETTVQRNKPQETKSQNKLAWIYNAFMKISTSTTEYVLLRSVLRGSICHFQRNLLGQLHVIQPPSSDSSFHTRNSIWFRELELDYGYLMTYCLSRKISGRDSRSLEASYFGDRWLKYRRFSKMARNVWEWCEHITILKWFVSRFRSQW